MADKKTKEIKDVMKEETSRGDRRKRVDTEARNERAKLRRAYSKLLDHESTADFLRAIRSLGIREGSSEFLLAMEAWDEKRSQH